MLSELSVYLRGSCRFTASGDFPERFLNLCARSDLGLWDIQRGENSISACVVAGRYHALLPLARKCGVRLRVSERFGLPFRLMPYRKRPGMPLGIILFFGTVWFLSLFVWSVTLPELSQDTSVKLSAALEEMGVTPGSLRSQVDGNRMSIELQLKVPELTWAGMSTYGSTVTVEAKEYSPPPAVKDDQPCNLIAARDGIILEIEPLRGSIEAERGSAVVKGDLLVSGVVEHQDGTIQLTHASAKVWAQTTHELTCTMPLRQPEAHRSGRVITRYRVRLLGLELPLLGSIREDGEFEREYSDYQLTIGSMKLPFEVRTEKSYELITQSVTRTPEQTQQLALEELERRIERLGIESITDRRTAVSCTDSSVTVKLTITVRENIAHAVPIGTE